MNQTYLKGLIMFVIAAIVAAANITGIPPANATGWLFLVVVAVINTAAYLLINWKWKSVSIWGSTDLFDVTKAFILACIQGIVAYLATLTVMPEKLDWATFWHTGFYAGLAYLGTKYGFGTKATTTEPVTPAVTKI